MAFQGVNKKGSNKKVIVPVTKLTDDEEYEIHQTFSLDHDLADEIAGFMSELLCFEDEILCSSDFN